MEVEAEAEAESAAHEVKATNSLSGWPVLAVISKAKPKYEDEDGDGEEEEEDWDRGLTTPVRNSDLCQCVSFTPHLKPVWPILAN